MIRTASASKVVPHARFEQLRSDLVSRFFGRKDNWLPQGLEGIGSILSYQSARTRAGMPGLLQRDAAWDQSNADLAMLRSSGLRDDIDCFVRRVLAGSDGLELHHASGVDLAIETAKAVAARASITMSPAFCHNVIGPASDPSIVGSLVGSIVNANLVDDEYSGAVGELEQALVRRMAHLVQFPDPSEAIGLFTGGGTMANTYGLLAGLRKAFPDSSKHGLGAIPIAERERVSVLSSAAGHYSNVTAMTTLGLDPDLNGERVDIATDNSVDVAHLRSQLRSLLDAGQRVVCIMLTAGTTDTFAVDDVAAVRRVAEEECADQAVPHIHVDAAVGWPLVVMQTYDSEENPLGLSDAALESLGALLPRVRGLREADSIGLDWHKWGLVAYPSSCIVFRSRSSLERFAQDQSLYSYFESSLAKGAHDGPQLEWPRVYGLSGFSLTSLPTERVHGGTVDSMLQQPITASAEESCAQAVAQPAEESRAQAVAQPAEDSCAQAVAQPAEESCAQAVAQPAEDSCAQAVAQPAEESRAQAVAQTAEDSCAQAVAQPAEVSNSSSGHRAGSVAVANGEEAGVESPDAGSPGTSGHPYGDHGGARPPAGRPLHELTVECSRAATGVFAAQMHVQALGVEGMQLCVGASLQTAAFARHALEADPRIGARVAIVPSSGPTVAFRLFPPGQTAKTHQEQADSALQALQAIVDGAAGATRMELQNLLHQDAFLSRVLRETAVSSGHHKAVYAWRERQAPGQRVLRTAWVGQLMHSGFTTPAHLRLDFPGEKAVFFNPATTHDLVQQWVRAVAAADDAISRA